MIMLIWGPVLLTIYLAALFVAGAWILRGLLEEPNEYGLHIPTSLMLGLFVSFLAFVFASLVSPAGAIYVSIAVPVITGSAAVLVDRSIVGSVFRGPWKTWMSVIGVTWLLLLVQYGVECSSLIVSVARGEGVIYQDIIYHGGIARSLALNGFPAQNLQYAGEYIGYHIFSHFIAAQVSTLLGTSLQVSYSFILGPLFFLLIAISLNAFINVISNRADIKVGIRVAIIYVSLLSIFLLSGTPDPSGPLYLSHSYQLQIASLAIVFSYLHKLYDGSINVTTRSTILVSVLLSQAVLIKGSSLPLILTAFGAWIGIEAVNRKRLDGSHLAILASLILASGIVYVAFFYAPGFTASPYDLNLYVNRLYSIHLVREAVELMGVHWIVVSAVAAASMLSYRLLLVYLPFSSYGGAVGTAFLTGIAMYLFMRYGANYYVLAMVCLTNVYCLTMTALHWTRLKWIVKTAVVACAFLSLYPISNGGYPSASIMLSRKADNYYPLTQEKLRLYRQLEAVSERESLIFTTSLAAASSGVADNYYPAALSGRTFYLGGHRLKTQAFPGLAERLEFVRQFTPLSPEDHRRLKELGVDFVLIETGDLRRTERDSTLEAVAASPLYRVIFENEAGVLLEPL